MNLLHRIGAELAVVRKQIAIKNALERLSPRALADLGLERREIPAVARLGARLGPEGATLRQVIERVQATPSASLADRLLGLLERVGERKTATRAYQPQDLERYREEARRLRAETLTAIWRAVATGASELVRPAVLAARESGVGRWLRLELVWRRAYRQLRTELGSYSERELMSDLRLTRAEIDEVAAEGADERVHAYLAADPALRRSAFGLRALHRAPGRA